MTQTQCKPYFDRVQDQIAGAYDVHKNYNFINKKSHL